MTSQGGSEKCTWSFLSPAAPMKHVYKKKKGSRAHNSAVENIFPPCSLACCPRTGANNNNNNGERSRFRFPDVGRSVKGKNLFISQ